MSVPQELLTEHANRGADLRRLLRLLLVIFIVAVLITEPPAEHLALCWVVVGCYLVWSLAIYALGTGDRTRRFLWLALFVDVAVLASLTLITDATAAVSWTPYLIINGFFLIPVIAAAQLSPTVCAAVVIPTVVVYLISGLITRDAEAEPLSYTVLRTLMLATVGLGAVLLSRLQRSRVQTIAGLLADRTALLSEMITIEQREQRNLADALHDGALQYVLGARQELEGLADGDPDAARRIDLALTESARLLRTSVSQLHPAVIEATGLLPALRDLVEATRARGRFAITLACDGWRDDDRTGADELLLTTARELLVNVAKHAAASTVLVELSRDNGSARLRISDDGRGMAAVDLSTRLAEGHLGLASRRIRIEAVGGTLSLHPADPQGTVVDVHLPLTPTPSRVASR
jgi:two-component system NarL family sensor kinase